MSVKNKLLIMRVLDKEQGAGWAFTVRRHTDEHYTIMLPEGRSVQGTGIGRIVSDSFSWYREQAIRLILDYLCENELTVSDLVLITPDVIAGQRSIMESNGDKILSIDVVNFVRPDKDSE